MGRKRNKNKHKNKKKNKQQQENVDQLDFLFPRTPGTKSYTTQSKGWSFKRTCEDYLERWAQGMYASQRIDYDTLEGCYETNAGRTLVVCEKCAHGHVLVNNYFASVAEKALLITEPETKEIVIYPGVEKTE